MQKLETRDNRNIGVVKRFFATTLDVFLIGLLFIMIMLFISNAGGSIWRSVSYIGERENNKNLDNIIGNNLPVRSSKKEEFQQNLEKLLFYENGKLKVPTKNFSSEQRKNIVDGIISNVEEHFTIRNLYADLAGQGEFLSDSNILDAFTEIYNENFIENFKSNYEALQPHFEIIPNDGNDLFYQKIRRELVKVLFPNPDDYEFKFDNKGFEERKTPEVEEIVNKRLDEYIKENQVDINKNSKKELQQALKDLYLLTNYRDTYIEKFKESLRYSFEKFILERIPTSQHRAYKKQQMKFDLDKIVNEILLSEEEFRFTTGQFSSEVNPISKIIDDSVKEYSLRAYRNQLNELISSSHLLEIFGDLFITKFGDELENELDDFLQDNISSKNRDRFIDKLSEDFINRLFVEEYFSIPSDKVKFSDKRIKKSAEQILRNIIKYHKIYLSKDILAYALNKTSEDTQNYLFSYYIGKTASDDSIKPTPLFETLLKYLEQSSRGVKISALVYLKAELYEQNPDDELINALTKYYDKVQGKNRQNLSQHFKKSYNSLLLDLLKGYRNEKVDSIDEELKTTLNNYISSITEDNFKEKFDNYENEDNQELVSLLSEFEQQISTNEDVIRMREYLDNISTLNVLEEWKKEKAKLFEEQSKKIIEIFENYLNKISKQEPYNTFIEIFESYIDLDPSETNRFPILTRVFKKYISVEKNKSDKDYLTTEEEDQRELDDLVNYYKESLSTKTYKELEDKVSNFVEKDSVMLSHFKDVHIYRANKRFHLALFVLSIVALLIFLLEGITRLSFGKLLLKIRIGNKDGSRGDIKIYLTRFLIKNIGLFVIIIASIFGLYTIVKAGYFIFLGILVIGSIPILFKNKRAIWDIISGSAVFSLNDIQLRLAKNSIFKVSIIVIGSLIIIPLVAILVFITYQGISVIDWEFLTTPKRLLSEGGGGIAHSLVGTLILIIIAVIASVPIGIASGIYLSEHPKGKFSSVLRTTVELFQGVPSIIIGLVGYLWLVITMGKPTALAGGLTLALMMFPLVIRSTEETLKLVPHTLKEASLALGVPYYKTLLKIVLPTGLSGIVTGILLGIGRIAGETAPLLFTVFGNQVISLNLKKPIDALPLLIYNYATGPSAELHSIAWGASFVLVVFVLLLNLITRIAISRQDK